MAVSSCLLSGVGGGGSLILYNYLNVDTVLIIQIGFPQKVSWIIKEVSSFFNIAEDNRVGTLELSPNTDKPMHDPVLS